MLLLFVLLLICFYLYARYLKCCTRNITHLDGVSFNRYSVISTYGTCNVINVLCFYVTTFRCVCAVPRLAVCCSFLMSWFPGIIIVVVFVFNDDYNDNNNIIIISSSDGRGGGKRISFLTLVHLLIPVNSEVNRNNVPYVQKCSSYLAVSSTGLHYKDRLVKY